MADIKSRGQAELVDACEELESILDAAHAGVIDLSPLLEKCLLDLLDHLWLELRPRVELCPTRSTLALSEMREPQPA
jgi:hypothetical protein